MGNLSQLALITQSAVIILFAELACLSASRANDIIERFPGFRAAKGSFSDPFWLSLGIDMLANCKKELSLCESLVNVGDWDELRENDF